MSFRLARSARPDSASRRRRAAPWAPLWSPAGGNIQSRDVSSRRPERNEQRGVCWEKWGIPRPCLSLYMPYIALSTSNGNFQHCIYYYVLLWYMIIYYITIYYTPWWDILEAWRWWLDLGQDSDLHQQKWDLKPRMVSCDHDLGTLEVGCLLKWWFFEALSGAVSAHRQCVNISLKKTLHISASWSSHNRVSIFV